MSRDLMILRHANALPLASGETDFERPLSPHGEQDAERVGQWLRDQGLRFDRALVSPATRAHATAERVLAVLGGPTPSPQRAIYEATPGQLIDLIDTHGAAGATLLVGHNPGLEELVAFLTAGRSDAFRGLPTCGAAWLTLGEGPLQPGMAQLRAVWSP